MKPFISIIVPMYNEELVISEIYEKLTGVLQANKFDYEIILVNDGSFDKTSVIAKEICKEDSNVRLINFSRNFGHQIAVTAGMDKATGDVVIVIDADLQDPPEVIIKMIEKWRQGYHVVYGKRKRRKGESIFKLMTASIFYRIIHFASPVEIAVDVGDFRLMDKKVVKQLNEMRERNRFLRGMVSWVGFRQCEVEYVREERYAGATKYPLKKMLKFALDGIFSFSQLPLKLASSLGFICSGISFLFIIYGIVVKLMFPERAVLGWASVFVAVLFLGGIQLICLGILGEYLGRVYEEEQKRPLYIIDEEINFD